MKKFKVTKSGKYFDVAYIGYISDISEFKFPCFNNIWFETADKARNYINYINDLEKEIDKIDKIHDTKKIIRFYLTIIDSILSGIDVRSDYSITKVAQLLVTYFTKRYQNSLKICEDIRQGVIDNKINRFSMAVEKYNNMNELFNFKLKSLDDYFNKPTFSELLNDTNTILDEMIEVSKQNKSK